jgi:hypothetical protein
MIADAINFLVKTQNPDGGWGATPDRQSNTEATAVAVIALGSWNEAATPSSVQRGIGWLLRLQRPDGSWPLRRDVDDPSWATALAVLGLARFDEHRRRTRDGARWLLGQRGRQLGWFASLLYRFAPERMPVRLNPDLQAWSWTPGALSWIEPTAYSLIALKNLEATGAGWASDRIAEGDRLLYDRMCEGGGWNYGNSRAFGVELRPYPETTALALIALQDRRAEAANQLSLKRLAILTNEVSSGLSLSWAALCFSIYGQPVTEWRQRLARLYRKTHFLGETRTIALALLALSDRPTAFHLAR